MKHIKKSPPKLQMLLQKKDGLDHMLAGALKKAREENRKPEVSGISAALRKVKEEMDESERRAIALQEAEELAAAQLAAVDAEAAPATGGDAPTE